MNVDCWLSGENVSETSTKTASSTSKLRNERSPPTALTAASASRIPLDSRPARRKPSPPRNSSRTTSLTNAGRSSRNDI